MKIVLAFTILFVFLGIILIPYNGLETDEVLFAQPLYGLINPTFAIRVFHHLVPLMLMSYIGALKSFIYWPLSWIFSPSVYFVRLPMVLVGGGQSWFSTNGLAHLQEHRGHFWPRCCWPLTRLSCSPTLLIGDLWLCSTCCWSPVVC